MLPQFARDNISSQWVSEIAVISEEEDRIWLTILKTIQFFAFLV